MAFSEIRKAEMQIGFLIGILIGAAAGGVLIVFFASMAWYFRLFSAVGSLGVIGTLLISLREQFKYRKEFIEAQRMMDELSNKNDKDANDITPKEISDLAI
jgi:hypothetical protein